jgi:ribonuclease HI
MELTPIIEGLRWIAYQSKNAKGIHVHVYSDSEYTIKTLCGVYPEQKNEDLWYGVRCVAANLLVTYTYRERNTHVYMTTCDAVCSTLRKKVIQDMNELMNNAKEPELIIPVVELPPESEDQTMKGLNENTAHSRSPFGIPAIRLPGAG